jgi:TPR repeat protein
MTTSVAGSSSQQAQPAYPEGIRPVPLKQVVDDAVQRWFQDTLSEAERGDIKQQALLGQMYAEGYGCQKDQRLAKHWSEKARQRGYRMKGVYCEL